MNTMKGMLIILGMKSMDIRMDAGRVQCIRTARSLSINVDYILLQNSCLKFFFAQNSWVHRHMRMSRSISSWWCFDVFCRKNKRLGLRMQLKLKCSPRCLLGLQNSKARVWGADCMERSTGPDLKLISCSVAISSCSKLVKWHKSLALLQAGAEWIRESAECWIMLNQKGGRTLGQFLKAALMIRWIFNGRSQAQVFNIPWSPTSGIIPGVSWLTSGTSPDAWSSRR